MALPLIMIFPLYSHLPLAPPFTLQLPLELQGLNSAILISVPVGPEGSRMACFPLLQCTPGNTQQRGKPCLGKPRFDPGLCICGFWLNCIAPSPASLDLVDRLQQLPPDIPLGIALFKSAGFIFRFIAKSFLKRFKDVRWNCVVLCFSTQGQQP